METESNCLWMCLWPHIHDSHGNAMSRLTPKWLGRGLCIWNLFVLYFGGWTLQNKVFSNQNKGHLDSRYMEKGSFSDEDDVIKKGNNPLWHPAN